MVLLCTRRILWRHNLPRLELRSWNGQQRALNLTPLNTFAMNTDCILGLFTQYQCPISLLTLNEHISYTEWAHIFTETLQNLVESLFRRVEVIIIATAITCKCGCDGEVSTNIWTYSGWANACHTLNLFVYVCEDILFPYLIPCLSTIIASSPHVLSTLPVDVSHSQGQVIIQNLSNKEVLFHHDW